MDSILTLAEQYILAGLQVHPCKGKIPTLKEWQKTRLDLAGFKRLFKPSNNIGLVTGKASGLICIDVDPRNGGMEWYDYHEAMDQLANPIVERTGSGGLHLYYKYPEGYDFIPSKTGFEKGIDILADGGKQVITAPSIHATGELYKIANSLTLIDALHEADPFPLWIIGELLNGSMIPSPIPAVNGHAIASSASLELAIQALRRLEPAVEGQAGDCRTFQAAAVLRDYGLSQKEALQVLREQYNPRCEPPWELGALTAKVRNAYSYAKGPIGSASPEQQFSVEEASIDHAVAVPTAYKPIRTSLGSFIGSKFPPRVHLLGPFVKQGLAMVYAPPGVGKTHFCLGVAFAIASGGSFLKWKCENRAKVLYIDGELPAYVLQERFKPLASLADSSTHFDIITPDQQPNGIMPDLGTKKGQDSIEEYVQDVDFIVIDNLSCLVRSGKENEAESWIPVQNWALRLRQMGKSVLFVHHSGKGEGASPRGTSKREDVLDLIIGLNHPMGYTADMGCIFEVKFRKARNYRTAQEISQFQAKYISTEFAPPCWEWEELEERNSNKIERLFKDGISQKDIAEELGVSKQYVSKVIKTMGPETAPKSWVD